MHDPVMSEGFDWPVFVTSNVDVLAKFARCLAVVENIAKTQTADTGKYTYTYADLGDVLDEVKRVCSDHGLSVFQVPGYDADKLTIATTVIDVESGDYLAFAPMGMRLPPDAQALGSALTYARRYSLLTIFGIAPEDDDGREATNAARTQPGRRTEAERMIRESIGQMEPDERKRFTDEFKHEFGSGLSDLPAARHGDALTWSRRWAEDRAMDASEAGPIADPNQLTIDELAGEAQEPNQ